ncbi:S-layer homology domain-containing protein [Paenibacillus gorillae]|uniref:S-layer homology domain-containing protein n=1 Tax=Paenibacillus gorillae TaxID=1243662 RepID=UPI0004AE126D|nr:S-layer homology domain-containing protein [Paenibacillus gorillae]
MNKRRLNKATAMLIVFSMIAGIMFGAGMPSTAHAEEDLTNFSGGDGTISNPYKVSSERELRNVTIPGPGAYFQQTGNIELSGNWTPLASFSGSYDGNGFGIYNMTINSGNQFLGLFSALAGGAELKNVSLIDFNTTSTGMNAFVGGLAGVVNANAKVTNSSSKGSIQAASANYAGGLVGMNEGLIEGSSSQAVITGSGNDVIAGGLAGTNVGSIKNSHTSGSLETYYYRSYAGGLAGTNTGTISGSGSSTTVTGGDAFTGGGLSASNPTGGVITESYSTGKVVGTSSGVVGGLTGRNTGNISRSFSTSDVDIGAGGIAGGLAGYKFDGLISDSYSTGNVLGNGAVFTGGLVGISQGGDVTNSYSTGSASGGTDANGGLIGYKPVGSVSDSYFYSTGGVVSQGGTPKDANALMQQSTFTSWDFSNVWRIAEGYAYPSLQWQPYSAKESTYYDYESLTWDSIKGTNSAANHVTENLQLPATGTAAGSAITWIVSQSSLINPATGKVTRASDDDYEVTLTATISRSGGETRTKSFVLIVIEAPNIKPNRKAAVDATASAKVTIHTAYSLDLSTIFEDVDGDPLSYNVSVNGAAAITANRAYTYTPTAAGAVTLVFTADDGEEESDDTYTIQITVNQAPARESNIGATTEAVVMVNTPYTLDLSAIFEDVDGDGLTYEVSINGATAVAATANYTYTPTTAGIVTLVFAANDGTSVSSDTYTVELTVNTAPVRRTGVDATAAAVVTVNTPYTVDLAAIFEDADSDELTYKVSINGATAVPANENYTYMPTAAGSETLVFSANDGVTDSADTYTVAVTVTANSAPVRRADVAATAEAALNVNAAYSLDLRDIFEDADNDALTYKVTVNGGSAAAAAESYSYTSTTVGIVTLVFTANDGFMDSTDRYTVTLTVSQPNNGNGNGSGGNGNGGNGGSGTGAGGGSPTIDYKVTVSGDVGTTLPIKVDQAAGHATVAIGALADSIFTGNKKTVLTVPDIPGVSIYTIEVAPQSLSSKQLEGELIFATHAGSIAIPSNMLQGVAGTEGKVAAITVRTGDKSGLSASAAAAIGDRPLLELTLKLDGTKINWNNPAAPVKVSIPYKPTAEELNDPEHIVVWYIDGNVISIPSGQYDAKSGTVTFVTTHFSSYAVAYVHKTFGDLDSVKWAKHPIEVMASKGIINGTSAGAFSPEARITRADFLVLLVKTLGLTSEFEGNFSDADSNAYYYEALGIAKQLGLATGSGNNEFHPKENISRQDMMVLTARALEKLKGLQPVQSSAGLDVYSDRKAVASYAELSLAVLAEAGLVNGSGNMLNPRGLTTRAEAAVFLYRIYNQYGAAIK